MAKATEKATLGLHKASRMPPDKTHHLAWEDNMGISNRRWSVDRRTVLKSGAADATAQFSSPFVINARGETPIKIAWSIH